MDLDALYTWTKRRLRIAIAWNTVAMFASFFGGLLVLFISFWVSYGVTWFISHSFYPLSHHTILLITAGFMTLVVIIGARQNWEDLDPLQRDVRLARDMDITLTPYTRYGMSYNTNAVKAGLFEIQSMTYVINYVLCGGVKLVFGSVGKLRQIKRLQAVESESCAQVFGLLLTNPRRYSFQEIVENLPGLNPVKTFDDLHYIEGVHYLSNDPAGLTLLPELREELSRL